jgi:hypothetical protein
MKLMQLIGLLVLTSCATAPVTQVESYQIHWEDTVVYEATHWHIQDVTGGWNCVELEADTIVLSIHDTIYVKTMINDKKPKIRNSRI